MPKRIALLHFASPPVVGGVEATIGQQARALAQAGYAVRVLSGEGGPFGDNRATVHIDPLLGSRDARILTAKRELDRGIISADFAALVAAIETLLRRFLEGCDVLIAHNTHTMNKNLALTMALRRISDQRSRLKVIAVCHDLAWTNPLYQAELYDRAPWDSLREAWAGTHYATVSEPRRAELAGLIGLPPATITAITPGIDPASFLNWTPTMRMLEDRLHLLDADVLLLLPARLTRRKNIALALHVLHGLNKRDQQDLQDLRDYRLIVTGPPGAHNPTNMGYLGELLDLRRTLGLEKSAHFLYELSDPPLVPDDATMGNLYGVADALLFPSEQEGFGIPILEAGLAGLPIFCTDIPPLRETGGPDVTYFDPSQAAPEEIAGLIHAHFEADARHRLRVRVRHTYRWDAIIHAKLIPLVEER